jgi:hypothetical protein
MITKVWNIVINYRFKTLSLISNSYYHAASQPASRQVMFNTESIQVASWGRKLGSD